MSPRYQKNLCVDFDGVLHMYTSPWLAAHIIADGPVPGAMDWLIEATSWAEYKIMIYSGRSRERKGIAAMSNWIEEQLYSQGLRPILVEEIMERIHFTSEKPAAYLTIDDRAFCFTGLFPDKIWLDTFKPWNRS